MPKPLKILIVDDDEPFCLDLGRRFEAAGFEVLLAHDAGHARQLCNQHKHLDWALIDAFRLPKGSFVSKFQIPLHDSWAVELADWMRRQRKKTQIVGLSNSAPQEIRDWFATNGRAYLKKGDFDAGSFAQTLRRVFRTAAPKCFIVHGHDTVARDNLKQLLKKKFKLPQVVILDQQSNRGTSLIEKLEREAGDTDVAFVLLTPDDSILPNNNVGQITKQSRPNVFIEAGWFHARFGRLSGRVILLRHRDACWPSDFQGLVWIDITNGVDKAANDIERELVAIGVIP